MILKLSTLVLSASAIALSAGFASAEQITFVSQGGAYQEAQTKAILDPVAELLGITINQDSSPDAWPVIKTQTATGKPVWDVIDTPTQDCIRGGQQGMIETLDFSKIPNAEKMPAEYKSPYSVAYEFYSSVLAYNKDKFVDKPPTSWADFWDVKTFPGTRALRNHPLATLEAALLADGVPAEKLYPLDATAPSRNSKRSSLMSPSGGHPARSPPSFWPMAKSIWKWPGTAASPPSPRKASPSATRSIRASCNTPRCAS